MIAYTYICIIIATLIGISVCLYIMYKRERTEKKSWDDYSNDIEKVYEAREILLRDQLNKAVKDCIDLKNKYRWKNVDIETPPHKNEIYLVSDGVFVFTATWKFLRSDENTKKEIWCWETNTKFYDSRMISNIIYWTQLNPFMEETKA